MNEPPRCVVCGKPRFLIDKEFCFDPLVCTVTCYNELKNTTNIENLTWWEIDKVYHEEDEYMSNVYWRSTLTEHTQQEL